MIDHEELLTVAQVAQILGLTDESIRRWIKLKTLPAVRLPSGGWRIRRSELDRVLGPQASGEVPS